MNTNWIQKAQQVIWKYISDNPGKLFSGIVSGIALLIPDVRDLLGRGFARIDHFLHSTYPISNLILVIGAIAILYLIFCLGVALYKLRSPRYEKEFLRAEYDGIEWNWQWRWGRVPRKLMTPYCPHCVTELLLTSKDHVTKVFCTECNKGFTVNVDDIGNHARLKIEGDARTGRWIKRNQATNEKDVELKSKYDEMITGTWLWQGRSAVVVIAKDGEVISTTREIATWRWISVRERTISMSWKGPTNWEDTLTLSPDGQKLNGKNQFGQSVEAMKHTNQNS